MVQRHVKEGEAHIRPQCEIIAELSQKDHPTADAEELLVNFEQPQAQHVVHLERLLNPR